MKRVTLLCGLLLAVSATVASAAGVNLRWTSCFGDGGAINRTFACNTNTGDNALSGSFLMNSDLASVSGVEIVVDIAASGASLPAWWQFKNPGTCRSTSLTMATNQAGSNCPDWGELGATGGIGAYNIGQRGPNTARVVAASAVPGDALKDLFGGQEYYAFSLHVGNQKTVGTGACAGCNIGVCIVFNSINITTPVAANNRKISGPTNLIDSDFTTWQGGGTPIVGGITGCGAATPTKSTTWGAVKSLYR